MVNAYGNTMPLNQVANINVPEPRMITVKVWDRGIVKAVDKAIREAGSASTRRPRGRRSGCRSPISTRSGAAN